MNKSELINAIAKDADVTKDVASRTLDSAIKSIISALQEGKNITLVGFGSFQIKERSARYGRNPQNGERIKISASKLPSFKAGKTFKNAVN